MTGLPLNGKHPDFAQLQVEMVAAGVGIVGGIGSDGVTVWTYDAQGQPADFSPAQLAAIQATIAAHTPNTGPRDAIITAIQSTVGVAIPALTQAQRLALIAALLYKAGAVDRQTGAILPLNQWLA